MVFKKLFALMTAVAILLSAGTVLAASLTDVNITQTVQKDDVFCVYFDALDVNGEAVAGISADAADVSIGSYKLDAQVSPFAESKQGVCYVFTVDISKSLNRKQFGMVKDALESWISGMGEEDFAAILSFGESINILTDDFTNDKMRLAAVVDGLEPSDMETQLYNGIEAAYNFADRRSDRFPDRRVVVMLSDGIDDYTTGSTKTADDVIPAVSRTGIPMYVVGFDKDGSSDRLNELARVAEAAGGMLFKATTDTLADGYGRAYERIESSYVAQLRLPAGMETGMQKALVLTVAENGIKTSDEVTVTVKPFAVSAPEFDAVPERTEAPKTAETKPTSSESGSEAKPVNVKLILIIAASVTVFSAGVLLIVIAIRRKNARKLEEEELERRKREELDMRLKAAPVPGARSDNTCDLNGMPSDAACIDRTAALNSNTPRRRLMLKLTEAGGTGSEYTVNIRTKVTVGRRVGENDIVLGDRTVSGRHCEFSLEADGIRLRDLGSVNRTVVNDTTELRYGQNVMIRNGDRIRLGETELRISIFEE